MKTILVVDDRPANVVLLEDILDSAGYQVISAQDGIQGLEQAKTHLPVLIISDILMPNMDGFEFCHSIGALPDFDKTPFLFLTGAYVSQDDEAFALIIGANRFMRRPFQNQDLLTIVSELLTTLPSQIQVPQPEMDEKRYLKEHVSRLTQALEDKVVELERVMQQNVLLLKDSKHHETELEKSLSELQDTQSYLVQTERLSAVGQLVAGVAHELNNPLAIIIGYAQLILRMPEVTPRMQECLNKLEDAGQRCQRIVHHLTIFAQKQKAEKRYLNVKDVLQSVIDIRVDQLQANRIQVDTSFDDRLMAVFADYQQLQQVFLSLINNAQEAVSTNTDKTRTLRIVSRLMDDAVAVDIIDNGQGISELDRAKLFEPFFTTKDFGQGVGLGLSVCYGIVKEHDGDIKISDTEGGGATFTITLPLYRISKPEEETSSPEQTQSTSNPPGARILIVDDEPGILDILSSTFQQDGYIVHTALRGEHGIDYINKNTYDAIILDIRLPDCNGTTLYKRIKALRPELAPRIIFVTGDTISHDTLSFIEKTENPYLTKPFDIDKVRQVVADRLSKD